MRPEILDRNMPATLLRVAVSLAKANLPNIDQSLYHDLNHGQFHCEDTERLQQQDLELLLDDIGAMAGPLTKRAPGEKLQAKELYRRIRAASSWFDQLPHGDDGLPAVFIVWGALLALQFVRIGTDEDVTGALIDGVDYFTVGEIIECTNEPEATTTAEAAGLLGVDMRYWKLLATLIGDGNDVITALDKTKTITAQS